MFVLFCAVFAFSCKFVIVEDKEKTVCVWVRAREKKREWHTSHNIVCCMKCKNKGFLHKIIIMTIIIIIINIIIAAVGHARELNWVGVILLLLFSMFTLAYQQLTCSRNWEHCALQWLQKKPWSDLQVYIIDRAPSTSESVTLRTLLSLSSLLSVESWNVPSGLSAVH